MQTWNWHVFDALIYFSEQWISSSHGMLFHFENWAWAVDPSDLKSAPRSESVHKKLIIPAYNYVHTDPFLHIICLSFLPADLKHFPTAFSWTVYTGLEADDRTTPLFLAPAYLLMNIYVYNLRATSELLRIECGSPLPPHKWGEFCAMKPTLNFPWAACHSLCVRVGLEQAMES